MRWNNKITRKERPTQPSRNALYEAMEEFIDSYHEELEGVSVDELVDANIYDDENFCDIILGERTRDGFDLADIYFSYLRKATEKTLEAWVHAYYVPNLFEVFNNGIGELVDFTDCPFWTEEQKIASFSHYNNRTATYNFLLNFEDTRRIRRRKYIAIPIEKLERGLKP